ncbi:imelysin family protein [Maritimibacter sp. HL-12]|uniref:imelysin family protein n=1 Tax=Maritimibacter sp. HL-12 TaxID=1162418 RepID=UPI000A0F0E9C|nr:imelysin family protein [Maritimibacter sp. HL-12]SMH47377.1 hypothetical protein SAMN05661107_1847 [Maritimibacter sp. HL-12]
MRFALAFVLAATLATPSQAGVAEALDDHILPGFASFAAASADLEAAARSDCTAPALAASFHDAFDAWLVVGDLRLGPSETGALSIAFWPDTRGFTEKTLASLIGAQNPIVDDPEAFAELSIAGRGLFALEMLLFDPDYSDYGTEDYRCALAQALASDLARQAAALSQGWSESFASVLLSAGADGNARFLSEEEAVRAIYTQILSALQFTTDSRIARPMGSFERPRPIRAEARRSGRSLTNVLASTQAAVDLAEALADWPLPETRAALGRVQEAAEAIEDPAFGDVDNPAARFRLEVLQQKVAAVTTAIEAEIGAPLGLSAGFNAQDGD